MMTDNKSVAHRSAKNISSRLTRSGARRMGDEYQDIQAIEHLVSWLKNTDRFEWFKVEADNAGYLDDILAMRADGTLELWQVKFSTAPNSPDDLWTWDKLLSSKKGKPSLFQKWFKTWAKLKAEYAILEPGLLSNRRAASEITDALQGQIAEWDRIPSNVKAEIINQLGNENDVREFFANFHFRIAEPGLREIEEATFIRFEKLSGTSDNWNRLEKAMRRWVSRKDEPSGGFITLDEIYKVTGLRANPIRLETFLPPLAFFEHYLEPHLFHHRLPLVGRREALRAMMKFVDEGKKVAILPGRGGTGKSRLVLELCRRLTRRDGDLPIRIVAENAKITVNSLRELPDEHCLIIVDDAHRVEGLDDLLRTARQNLKMKVLLVTRPHGTDYLQAEAKYSGFDGREIESWSPLRDLNARERQRLAGITLGKELAHHRNELASVTHDCPLLTVIGGELLRDKKVTPKLLVQNSDFRQEVLHRFRDITFGEVIEKLDNRFSPQLCSKVLPLISVTSPLHLKDKALLQKMAELADTDAITLVKLLDALVEAGALVRGGNLARIVPDVLSDYILQEVCSTSDGGSTGWAEMAFDSLSEVALDAVLRNLAELDWRVRKESEFTTDEMTTSSTKVNLLEDVWKSIEDRFRAANLPDRAAWLTRFERLSFMQAARLWRIVEIVIHEPTDEVAEEVPSHLRHWLKPTTQEKVRQQLTPILKGVACDARFTTGCAELLWELGRDVEVQSRSIQGALAALKDLATCNYNKPLLFNYLILDCCRGWMKDPQIHSYCNSVLMIIAPLLERCWEYGSERDHWQSNNSLLLPPEPVKELHNGALALVEQCAMSGVRRIVLQALDCLKQPISEEGLWELDKEDPKERDRWQEEQLSALDIVHSIAQTNDDPFIRIAIWEVCFDQAKNGPRIEVRTRARAILNNLSHNFECLFIIAWTRRLAWDTYARVWENKDDIKEEVDKEDTAVISQQRYEREQQILGKVTAEWVKRYPQSEDGFHALNDWITRIETSEWWKGPWTMQNPFLLKLTLGFPDYAKGLCEAAIKSPHTRMSCLTSDLLFALRSQNAESSLPIVRRFMATNELTLAHAVSESYSWRGWPEQPLDEEWTLVRQLLDFTHSQVRCSAAGIIKAIALSCPARALQMILETNTIGDSKLTLELFEAFSEETMSVASLSSEQLETMLSKLEISENIEDFYFGRFLRYAAIQDPVAVARLLLFRIRQGNQLHEDWIKSQEEMRQDREALYEKYRKFEPLPRNGFQDEKLRDMGKHPEFIDALRLIRDAVLDKSLIKKDKIASVYRDFSIGYNPVSLDVLNEWINSEKPEKVKEAVHLLEATSMGFYFQHVDFVTHYLERASECGFTVLEEVERAILHCAEFGPPGVMASPAGERSNALFRGAQDVIEKMKLDIEIRSRLAIGFYSKLKARGEELIQQEKTESESEEIFFRSYYRVN